MARPSKAVNNIKKHLTEAEKVQRGAAEKASLTGLQIRESEDVKTDPVAHAEFTRVRGLLSAVEKDDALFEAVINDYCQYKSDISRYVKMRREIEADHSIEGSSRYKLIMDCDKQAEVFRKKRFDIEKENGFTIASALRSIPKKVEPDSNPLLKALIGDD